MADAEDFWYAATKVADLPEGGVRSVRTPWGLLAVGLRDEAPFAVSGRCRHLLAELGRGELSTEGELVCPWHGARYDVDTGRMTGGPGGLFRPTGPPLKLACATIAPLRRFRARVRDGRIEIQR